MMLAKPRLPKRQTPSQADVLIVGGGPVGLLLGYILLKGGHKVLLVGMSFVLCLRGVDSRH